MTGIGVGSVGAGVGGSVGSGVGVVGANVVGRGLKNKAFSSYIII